MTRTRSLVVLLAALALPISANAQFIGGGVTATAPMTTGQIVCSSGPNTIATDGSCSGGGGPPTGAAGGSLSGTYPNPALATSVSLPGSPTTTTQAPGDSTTKVATTAFVAAALAGVNPAVAVSAATIAASDTSGFTYNNGVAGIGATFTGTTNTAITIDGFTFSALGQRLLVKNDTQSPSGAFNGVYYVTQLQTGLLPPILTRALDYDMPSDINSTGAIPVVNGTINASTSWLLTSNVTTVGTDPLTYTVFSYNPTSLLRTVAQSHIPFGIAGFTTTASAGALVGIANGAIQWTNAYLWAPANSICTSGQSAGWYFTQFSSSNAGTIFNNTYTGPGVATVPGSPTAFVCTSTNASQVPPTTELAGLELTIPANSMGANGTLRVYTTAALTSSAGTKTIRTRFGTAGTGGQLASNTAAFTTTAAASPFVGISNAGLTNDQYGTASLGYGSTGAAGQTVTHTTLDTTQAQVITITGQLGTNTDYLYMISTDIDLRAAP